MQVIDSGQGFAPEVKARLFTPFTQADNSVARRFGGTGLGLAISHRLVGLMGGVIDADSMPGEGADSGTVVSILVKAGAAVKKGQNIIELETGKAVAPIPSPAAGTVARLAVKEGDKISVGQLILVLDGAGEAKGSDAAPAPAHRS